MVFTMRSVSSTLPTNVLESMKTIELLKFRLDLDSPYCTLCVSGSYVIEGINHTTMVILLTKLALSPVGIAGMEGPVRNIRTHKLFAYLHRRWKYVWQVKYPGSTDGFT